MKILVCVKQIPDNTAGIRINSRRNRIEIPDSAKYRMNRFDEYAVEEAISIKESHPGTTVDVVSVGYDSAEGIIRRAMGMGADNGLMVHTSADAFLSPAAVSGILAEVARKNSYDLIFTGIMSEDEMNAQTGQMLAARLDFSCVTGIVKISFMNESNDIRVEREAENGAREILMVKMPALLTIQAGINRPRYPSLSALLRATGREIRRFADTLSIPGNAENDQTVVRISMAEKIRKGKKLEGTTSEKAKQLITVLKERNVLI